MTSNNNELKTLCVVTEKKPDASLVSIFSEAVVAVPSVKLMFLPLKRLADLNPEESLVWNMTSEDTRLNFSNFPFQVNSTPFSCDTALFGKKELGTSVLMSPKWNKVWYGVQTEKVFKKEFRPNAAIFFLEEKNKEKLFEFKSTNLGEMALDFLGVLRTAKLNFKKNRPDLCIMKFSQDAKTITNVSTTGLFDVVWTMDYLNHAVSHVLRMWSAEMNKKEK